MKNTFHLVRDLTGPGQEISCANTSNPLGRPKNRAKTGTFLHRCQQQLVAGVVELLAQSDLAMKSYP
jgi:hypothetical protein